MKTRTNFAIAAAALGGLIAGSSARAMTLSSTGAPAVASVSHVRTTSIGDQAGVKAKILMDDDTKGKHDCKGKNDCKGMGGCKSSDNGCKGKNSCKGKGGCDTNHPKDDK